MPSLSHLKHAPWIMALVAMGALTSAGQQPAAPQPDDLQKQLQQLKQQYDATTHDMEQRIAALEQQIEKQKEAAEKRKAGTVSAVGPGAQPDAPKTLVAGYNE